VSNKEVVELNVQVDHVHLLVMIPPKGSVSDFMDMVKGRTAIRVFNKFRRLKRRHYRGIPGPKAFEDYRL
jgi:putative transposase